MLGLRRKVVYQVVEVEKPKSLPHADEDLKAAVRSLDRHPGFQYLMAKLKLQRALLDTKLRNERHASVRDIDFIQSGIQWIGWLEDQVNREVSATRKPHPVTASDIEAQLFEAAQSYIETVG